MFSKSSIYAMKIMIYLKLKCNESENYIGVEEISKAIGTPQAFTAKILQQLSRARLIKSIRGRNGGFHLSPDRSTSIAEIVTVIDGDQLLNGCVLGFDECSEERPCPAHHKFIGLRNYLKKNLESTSIEEMKNHVEEGKGFIKYER